MLEVVVWVSSSSRCSHELVRPRITLEMLGLVPASHRMLGNPSAESQCMGKGGSRRNGSDLENFYQAKGESRPYFEKLDGI